MSSSSSSSIPGSIFVVVGLLFLAVIGVVIWMSVTHVGATPAQNIVTTGGGGSQPLTPTSSSSSSSSSSDSDATGLTGVTGDVELFHNNIILKPPQFLTKPTVQQPNVPHPPAPLTQTHPAPPPPQSTTTVQTNPPMTSSSSSSSSSSSLATSLNKALLNLQQCQKMAENDPSKLETCWEQYGQAVSNSCLPSTSSLSSSATTTFHESTPLLDRLDTAIEAYLACMESDELQNDRQSCVDKLLSDIGQSINVTIMTPADQLNFSNAQNELQQSLQRSTSLAGDYVCLRQFYTQCTAKYQLPIIPLVTKRARIYATNKAVASNCSAQAAQILRNCMDSTKTISNPAQRFTANNLCIKEYKNQLNTCISLCYGSSLDGSMMG